MSAASYDERLRQLFEKYGVSQRETAKRAGIHHVTICRIVSGEYKRAPKEQTLVRMMQALGCTEAEMREVLALAGYQHKCEAVRLLRQVRDSINEVGAEAVDSELWSEVDRVVEDGAVSL